MFHPEIISEIKAHALADFPKESVGLVTNSGYVRLANTSDDPENAFSFAPEEMLREGILGVVHSHPGGPGFPSHTDMEQQIAMGLPWGIIVVDNESCGDVIWWGDGVPIPPLIGRDFRHGPSGSDNKGDCYALIKDWWKVERGIDLPEFPRDDRWWDEGKNLYLTGFSIAGFREIHFDQIEPGDVVLAPVVSPVPNHGGVYVGNSLLLHHLPQRLSREEPIMRWRSHITHVLRHASHGA